MTDSELEQRRARAANETLVIAPTEGGFRVYNPANITHLYMVSGIPEAPQCNCPDFETHRSDREWRCKHILAVLKQMEKRPGPAGAADSRSEKEEKNDEAKPPDPQEQKKTRATRNGTHSQVLIKRSVSPDGRINSISIEFIVPFDVGNEEEVKKGAEKALKIQEEIVRKFLAENGSRSPAGESQKRENGNASEKSTAGTKPPEGPKNPDGAVPAQLLNIAGMNTRGGWKTFLNVQVNGTTTKLFGTKRELGEHISAAGFPRIAENISQGMLLNLPCRVVTKRSQDGKYLNIERVLSAQLFEENSRKDQ